MNYYSTNRPISPGSVPTRLKIQELVNYDHRREVKPGVYAWGWVAYDGKLTSKECEDHELMPAWYASYIEVKTNGSIAVIQPKRVSRENAEPTIPDTHGIWSAFFEQIEEAKCFASEIELKAG